MSPRRIPVGSSPFHVVELYRRRRPPPFTSLFVRPVKKGGSKRLTSWPASGEDKFALAVTDTLRVLGHQADFFRKVLVCEFVVTGCWSLTNFLVPDQFSGPPAVLRLLLASLPVRYMLCCRVDPGKYSNPGSPVQDYCHFGSANVKN